MANVRIWRQQLRRKQGYSVHCVIMVFKTKWHRMTHIGWYVNKGGHHYSHYDFIKWKHFPRYCPFEWGIYLSLVGSPHKGTVTRSFVVSLLVVWSECWTNTGLTGNSRRHDGHLTLPCWDHGLTPVRCHAIISTNKSLLLIESLGRNFSEIWIKMQSSFTKINLKMSSHLTRTIDIKIVPYTSLMLHPEISGIYLLSNLIKLLVWLFPSCSNLC